MSHRRLLNVFLNYFNPCNLRNLRTKNHKKPHPPKIAQMPQISTQNLNEWEYKPRMSLTVLNGPFPQQFPENLLYCGTQKSALNAILTLLTGFNGGLTKIKTKKVLNPKKQEKSQPRFLGFLIFSREVTRRNAKFLATKLHKDTLRKEVKFK